MCCDPQLSVVCGEDEFGLDRPSNQRAREMDRVKRADSGCKRIRRSFEHGCVEHDEVERTKVLEHRSATHRDVLIGQGELHARPIDGAETFGPNQLSARA